MRKRNTGFTLTELLVVASIIIILLLMMAMCVDGICTYAQRVKCQHRLEQCWQACTMYANGSQGILPGSWDFSNSRPWYQTLYDLGYIDSLDSASCPTSDVSTMMGTGQSSSGAVLSPAMRTSITKALDNLKATQQSNGSWAGGRADQIYGSVGTALLAFEGFGVTETHADYGPTLKKGIDFMLAQPAAGATANAPAPWTTEWSDYTQGVATMALANTYQMGNTRVLTVLQKSYDHLCGRQANTNYGGFMECGDGRAGPVVPAGIPAGGPVIIEKHGPQLDLSACAWGYQGLAEAKNAGLVPSASTAITRASSDALSERFFITSITVDLYTCNGCSNLRSGGPPSKIHGRDRTPGPLAGTWKCPVCGSTSQTKVADDYRSYYWMNADGSGPRINQSPWGMTTKNLWSRLLHGHVPTQNHAPRTYDAGENAYNQLAYLTGLQDAQGNLLSPPLTGDARPHIKLAKGTEIWAVATSGYDVYTSYYMTVVLWKCGGPLWDEWVQVYPPVLISKQVLSPGYPKVDGSFSTNHVPYCPTWAAPCVPTALAAIALEACGGRSIQGSKFNVSNAGAHSYGYNKLIASDTAKVHQRPAGDTIAVMDYMRSGIDQNDSPESIATRHSGKANVVFCDGHADMMTYEQLTVTSGVTTILKKGLLTPDAGD